MKYLENYKKDEFIEKLQRALGFTLTDFQKRYILAEPGVNLIDEVKNKRRSGITTIHVVKQILQNEIVNLAHMEEISDAFTFTDVKTEAFRYSKDFYRDYFMEIRAKLIKENFKVCKIKYRP